MFELAMVAVVNITFSPSPVPLSGEESSKGREPFMQRPRDSEKKKIMQHSNEFRFHKGREQGLEIQQGKGEDQGHHTLSQVQESRPARKGDGKPRRVFSQL